MSLIKTLGIDLKEAEKKEPKKEPDNRQEELRLKRKLGTIDAVRRELDKLEAFLKDQTRLEGSKDFAFEETRVTIYRLFKEHAKDFNK